MTVMAERPMTMTGTDPHSFEGMLHTLDDLNVPVGFKAEIVRGNIVFWGPYAKGYECRLTKPFGEKLPLPEPFDCVLDTTGFHAPQEPEQG
ncbi:hypothetical protein [Streptomyces sp. B3I8]|uniref:hypothetical protein n=1 Tax=Streptomyces sp. B3I8 TaxID=3042303 RepID=UPI00278AB71C|nr:hypothetical protein [Streptomyces sp. B3I8]MDQ0788247.1 hypothetical protein [Streptomyces sp. B3I8]